MKKLILVLLVMTVGLGLIGCSDKKENTVAEYKPSFITVDSNTVPYKVAKYNNEVKEEQDAYTEELNNKTEIYNNRVEQYNSIENDVVKNNITEIVIEDTVGNVEWTVTEQGDVIYNNITFTDLKTNVDSIVNTMYSSREIIDFIVHNFNLTGSSNIVFSRLSVNEENISYEEITEDSQEIVNYSTFLDRFYNIDNYEKFIKEHNNKDIAWTLCVYEYGYTHLAEIHGNDEYVMSLSSIEQDKIVYQVKADGIEEQTEELETSTEIETETITEIETETSTEIEVTLE